MIGVPVTSARSLQDAYAALGRGTPNLRVLAGGTDLMVQLEARVGLDKIAAVLDIWRVPELRGLAYVNGHLQIGALTTYRELMTAPLVAEHLPALRDVSREVGAWAIQNRGTLGGNVCNASPAGDTLPLLIAADAQLRLGGPRGERTVPADQFFVGYRKTALAADELLLRIDVPIAERGRLVYRKVGTRRAQSISRTLLAARGAFVNGRLQMVRVAAGCVAEVPLRCRAVEAAVEGAAIDDALLARARAALDADIRPIDDLRATAKYRRVVSGNVLAGLLRSLAT